MRLEMALNIGFNCAKEIINDSMGSSYDTVTTYWRTNPADDIGYLLSGYPRNLVGTTPTPQMYWFAAFSTARMTELATNAPPTAVMTNRATVDNQSMFSNTISNLMAGLTNFGANGSTNIELIGHTSANPRLSPPVGWMTIKQPVRTTPGKTNTTPTPVMRIAFFTEDLSGLIDAERMCGSTTRDTGTNPTEISMSNIGPTPGITFSNSAITRATYLSPFLLASNGGIATTNLRYFATGLRSWTNAVQRIPRAIAIATSKTYGGAIVASGAKVVIDSNSTVSKIATALTTNLPDFGARGGAMNPTAYISNIAANIVDYVDTNSIPSVDNGANPTYLGIENIPWPNELFDRIKFTDVTSAGLIRIELKDYVEVWNMGSKTIPTGTTITISNNYDLMLTMTNTIASVGFTRNLNLFEFESGSLGKRDFALPNNLLPNGYLVLESSSSPSTRRLSVTLTNPALYSSAAVRNAWAIYADQANATTNMSYTAFIGTSVIQKTISGRWTRYLSPSSKMTPPSGFYRFCNNIGYASQTAISGVPSHTGGDPRAQLFLSGALYNQNYTNGYASPGGRNVGRLQLPTYPESEVNPLKFWPDNGHATNADYGGNPTAFSTGPTSFNITPITNNWVMKRNDTGALTNIIELGNIYDPMQWSDQAGSGVAAQPGLWTNLTAAAIPDARFGGRNTLRIGRPEFTRFAFTNLGAATDLPVPNMGQSAAALLDVFCLTTNGIDDGGKININTAPGAVLAALAGGISLKADSAKAGTEVNAIMVAAFTNGVMKFRQAYPFYSTSQLPFISTNYGDANWTNTWNASTVFSTNTGCGLKGITELNDQGREEWFSKIYGLSSVQSRNFRIYVYAQMVNSNNVPYGRIMRKYYHLYTEQSAENPDELFNDAGFSMVPERESEY
ncbi:MAG: hypothetical protein NTY56_00510 [Patescibacteria group bacterium]|nr:hypothetical protein [Patescibacteria group bacterium]